LNVSLQLNLEGLLGQRADQLADVLIDPSPKNLLPVAVF